MSMDIIRKIVEESRFCRAKEGGEGYVPKAECVCTKENPCSSILDRERFHKNFENMSIEDVIAKRDELLQIIKPEFEGSQWYRDNVDE